MKLALALAGLAGLGLAQQTVTQYVQLEPLVARPGQTVIIRACVQSAAVSRVVLEPRVAGQPVISELVSQGGCIWRGSFVMPGAGVDDVFRPDFGFLRLYSGGTLIETTNVFPEVFTNELPLLPVVPLGPGVQRTSHVVNVVEPRMFPSTESRIFQPDLAAATSRLYQYLPDQFDQLNIVFGRRYFANRYHVVVRQNATGIGENLTNLNADSYGSAARLQGVNVFPQSPAFDGGERTQSHEFAHQWVNYIRFGALAGGGAHWPVSSIASGVMGSDAGAFGCALKLENGLLVSSAAPSQKVFNPLDLYLMGLIPAEEVPDQYVVTDTAAQNALRTNCARAPLQPGQFEVIRISDLVDRLGVRAPGPKQYRLATVVVSDRLLNQEEMSFYSFFARRAEERVRVWVKQGFGAEYSNPMWVATGGRLSLDTRIVQEPVAEIAGGGVVNGASFSAAQALSPGGLASIFGANLGGGNAGATALPLPTNLGGTRVFVNGRTAPLFFSSAGQVNFVVPTDVVASPQGVVSVRVESGTGASNVSYVPLRANAPSLFTYGEGRAILVDAQNRLIGADNPARPLQTVVLYLTGIGQTNPGVVAGEAAPSSVLAQCALRPIIRFPSAQVGAEFCGLTPGLTGLAQINFRIPFNQGEGDVPLEVVWGGVTSNPAVIRLRQ